MSKKEIVKNLKDFWDYIRFADMGSMGEGCLISAFIWVIIIVIISSVIGMVFN